MKRLDFDQAVNALARGEVVAIPTDTVYGVAASLAHPAAIERLFALKKRPASVALPVLLSDAEDARRLGVVLDERARRLVARWWPGPLTVVVACPDDVATLVHSRSASVGLRVPDDDLARRLIARVGPLCVTSANLHGEEPCTSPEDVEASFAGRDELAGVLDDGPRHEGVSSVVDVSGDEVIVRRHGAVGEDEIRAALANPE